MNESPATVIIFDMIIKPVLVILFELNCTQLLNIVGLMDQKFKRTVWSSDVFINYSISIINRESDIWGRNLNDQRGGGERDQ